MTSRFAECQPHPKSEPLVVGAGLQRSCEANSDNPLYRALGSLLDQLSRTLSDGVSLPAYTSTRYSAFGMAIRSFADSKVEDFFITGRIPRRAGWSGVARVARRKLDMLDYAHRLGDLRAPPGNRLEALKHDLSGFHSIRVNDQWRVVFRWTDVGPADVDILDYH